MLEVLSALLSPLGEKRRKLIMGWVTREIHAHALVQYVYEEGPPLTKAKDEATGETYDAGGPQIWLIGKPSPLDPSETVFAMFETDGPAVAVYSFKPVEVDGREATFFFRSIIFKPIHIHGPVHHDALTGELGAFLDDEDDEPADKHRTNGASYSDDDEERDGADA